MAEIRGMQMPEPSSGGGGSLTNQIMGIYRERTKAQRALEMMAYQSAMNVAGHVAKTKLGAEALGEADIEHTKRIFNPATWGDEAWAKKAAEVRQKQYEEAGIRDISGTKLAYQSRGTVGYTPKETTPEKDRMSTDAAKMFMRNIPTTEAPETPTVNDQPQTITTPNVGNRRPNASKGGYKKPPMPTFTTPTTGVQTTGSTAAPKVNRPKTSRPRVKKPGMGQMPNTPPTGGTNA